MCFACRLDVPRSLQSTSLVPDLVQSTCEIRATMTPASLRHCSPNYVSRTLLEFALFCCVLRATCLRTKVHILTVPTRPTNREFEATSCSPHKQTTIHEEPRFALIVLSWFVGYEEIQHSHPLAASTALNQLAVVVAQYISISRSHLLSCHALHHTKLCSSLSAPAATGRTP